MVALPLPDRELEALRQWEGGRGHHVHEGRSKDCEDDPRAKQRDEVEIRGAPQSRHDHRQRAQNSTYAMVSPAASRSVPSTGSRWRTTASPSNTRSVLTTSETRSASLRARTRNADTGCARISSHVPASCPPDQMSYDSAITKERSDEGQDERQIEIAERAQERVGEVGVV